MSVKENKAVVKRWNEEIVTGKQFEAFGEVLAKNYAHYVPSDSSWPPDAQGIDQARAAFEEGLAERPTWRVSVDDMIGEGDKVAARLSFYEGDKPRGLAIVIYGFSDGKIVDDWVCSAEVQD